MSGRKGAVKGGGGWDAPVAPRGYVPPSAPSNLLQSLESCACDPVAVAVCFVTRVRGHGGGDAWGWGCGAQLLSPRPRCPQSQEFDIYTQYCNNYPK